MSNATDVLLVEPNRQDADTVRRVISKQGRKGIVVTDTHSAGDYLFAPGTYATAGDGPPPKVILLDLWTPHADGCEMLRRIRSSAATKGVPVVVLSSSRNDWDVLRCYQLGANSYLSKPERPDELVKVVYEVAHYWMNGGGTGDLAGLPTAR